MILDRRTFVAGSAALLLPGCATVGSRRGSGGGCSPLAPLAVDRSLVVRTVAGLRPYRSSGFVVRREQLGDKALVHNYGHGGSGITFSWGTSRLALDLGLQGHSGPVAVLGAGVMGLTTARLVQEAGLPVSIYTAAMPPQTTSNIAGGQIMPSSLFREADVTPQWRQQYDAALDYSVRRWELLLGPKYGVRRLPTYIESDGSPPPQHILRAASGWRELDRREHPFPIELVARYETMYVETHRFLQQQTADVLAGGGKIRLRRFGTPADIASLEETLVINCTGLGSRELFGDDQLIPVRGQLAILAAQPQVNYAYTVHAGYMFPRADGVILGGTFERDVWDATPQPADIAHIVESHRALQAGYRCSA
jgi:glycine/D-amino acid oxidase-like deaminating enzyme